MPTQPLLTPYTAAEVEDAAGLVALRKQQHDEALVGLGYAKAAAKEAQEALAQAFTDWLKARASYRAQQTPEAEDMALEVSHRGGTVRLDAAFGAKVDAVLEREGAGAAGGRGAE